jgi:L-ascorbate oxidase
MTVVEADGNYVEPFETKNLYINSGETYSVLVKADQNSSRNYWITTNVVSREPSTPTSLAIFNYSPNPPDKDLIPKVPITGPLWNDTASQLAQSRAIKAHHDFVHRPPPRSDRVIVLLNTQNSIDDYYRWSLNNRSLALPHTPYLIAVKENFTDAFDQNPPPDSYDIHNYDIFSVPNNTNATSSNAIYRISFNTTVDIILQNANTMTQNNSETHPWHMHGHDFWVLAYGKNKFDKEKDPAKYNLVDPIMKKTVPLYPYRWTTLRFRAGNPGVWIFHCHIEPHLFMGMGIVFEVGVEMVGTLPTSNMGCGETKRFIRPWILIIIHMFPIYMGFIFSLLNYSPYMCDCNQIFVILLPYLYCIHLPHFAYK